MAASRRDCWKQFPFDSADKPLKSYLSDDSLRSAKSTTASQDDSEERHVESTPSEPTRSALSSWIPSTILRHMRRHSCADQIGDVAMSRIVPAAAGGRDVNRFLPTNPATRCTKKKRRPAIPTRVLREPQRVDGNAEQPRLSLPRQPRRAPAAADAALDAVRASSTRIHRAIEARHAAIAEAAAALEQHRRSPDVVDDAFRSAEQSLLALVASLTGLEEELASQCVEPLARSLGVHCVEQGYVLRDARQQFSAWLSGVSAVAASFRSHTEHLHVEAIVAHAQAADMRRRFLATHRRLAEKAALLAHEDERKHMADVAIAQLEVKAAEQSRVHSSVMCQAMFRGARARRFADMRRKEHRQHAETPAVEIIEDVVFDEQVAVKSLATFTGVLLPAPVDVVDCESWSPDYESNTDTQRRALCVQKFWRGRQQHQRFSPLLRAHRYRVDVELGRAAIETLKLVRAHVAKLEHALHSRSGPRTAGFSTNDLDRSDAFGSLKTNLGVLLATHVANRGLKLLVAVNTSTRMRLLITSSRTLLRRAWATTVLRRLIERWHHYWHDHRPVSRKKIDIVSMFECEHSDREPCPTTNMELAAASSCEPPTPKPRASSDLPADQLTVLLDNAKVSDFEHLTSVDRAKVSDFKYLTSVDRAEVSDFEHLRSVDRAKVSDFEPITSVDRAKVSDFEHFTSGEHEFTDDLATTSSPELSSNNTIRSRRMVRDAKIFAGPDVTSHDNDMNDETPFRTRQNGNTEGQASQEPIFTVRRTGCPLTLALDKILLWRGRIEPRWDGLTRARKVGALVNSIRIQGIPWVRKHTADIIGTLIVHMRSSWQLLSVTGLVNQATPTTMPALGYFPLRGAPLSGDLRRALALGWRAAQNQSNSTHPAVAQVGKLPFDFARVGACCVDAPSVIHTVVLALHGGGSLAHGDVALELYATVRHLSTVKTSSGLDPLLGMLVETLASRTPSPVLPFVAFVTALLFETGRGHILCGAVDGRRCASEPASVNAQPDLSFLRATHSHALKAQQSVAQRRGFADDDLDDYGYPHGLPGSYACERIALQAVVSTAADHAERPRFVSLARALRILSLLFAVDANVTGDAIQRVVAGDRNSPCANCATSHTNSRATEPVNNPASDAYPVVAPTPTTGSLLENPEKRGGACKAIDPNTFEELCSCIRRMLQQRVVLVSGGGDEEPCVELDSFRHMLVKCHLQQVERLRCAHATTVLFEAADHDTDGRLCWSEFLLAYYALQPNAEEGEVLVIFEQALYDTQTPSLDYGAFDDVVRDLVLRIVTQGTIREASRFLGRDGTSVIRDLWPPAIVADT